MNIGRLHWNTTLQLLGAEEGVWKGRKWWPYKGHHVIKPIPAYTSYNVNIPNSVPIYFLLFSLGK